MLPITMALMMTMLGAQATTEDYGVFETPGFRCTIGNNAALGEHAERYNGVFGIAAEGIDASPFVPRYAGLNLEHYFDSRPRPKDGDVLFEPRVAPMTFERMDANTAELYQPATPVFGVESWTRFEVKAPYYVDMDYRCVPRKDAFVSDFFGVFWASYINAPLDKSIYFLDAGSTLDDPRWVQVCTQQHGSLSTIRHEADDLETPFEAPDGLLFGEDALLRYAEHFFYGRFRDRVLIYIFAPGPTIRFAHSPSGGGRTASGDATNPAWDFQLIVPDYKVGETYRLRMRLVFKPWAGRDDVLREVRKYRD